MEIDFADIRIVGLDEEMTVVSPVRPMLFHVFLRLSQTPPPLWQNFFKDQRKMSRHPHWRHAWIDRKFIVVECLPAEIELYHLNDLRRDVAEANRLYRKFLIGNAKPEVNRERNEVEERARLREMKGRLTFD